MFHKRVTAAVGTAALLGGLGVAALASAGVAHASTTFVATTSLTNRPDSGNNANNGGDWAVDTLTRVATLTDLGVDPHNGNLEQYSFGLVDKGTFVTDVGMASNPNGLSPLTLLLAQSGTVNGKGTWSNFDVPKNVHPSTGGVPASEDGTGSPSSDWLKFFFPKYTEFLCPPSGLESVESVSDCGTEVAFSYSYITCTEHWLDANTDNDGNAQGVTDTTDLATIGGISGKACPTPTPTPSGSPTPGPTITPPPSTPLSGVPTGGVQTGGGLPVSHGSDWWIALIPLAGGLSIMGPRLIAARRRVKAQG